MQFNEAILKGLSINLSGAIDLFVYVPLGFNFLLGKCHGKSAIRQWRLWRAQYDAP
jgi:hypothetical protein